MGLINKLKNILFEEEEVEIPVIEKKETLKEVKELPKNNDRLDFYSTPREEIKVENKELPKKEVEQISEREIFKNERTFNFPAFDEEEFDRISISNPKPPVKRNNPILTREKSKPKEEVPKKEEPIKKFKPSPIISPVYGILDKNYTPEEITSRSDIQSQRLEFEDVRKKAFGEPPKALKEEVPKQTPEEEQILEERLEKMRTIDELLNDSTDEIISLDELDKKTKEIDHQEELTEPSFKEENIPDEEIEENESDLFDLIDSMYENREEER